MFKLTLTSGEHGLEVRTGEPPIRKQLQDIIDKASWNKPRLPNFVEKLNKAGVSIRPSGKTGTPQGISFQFNGIAFKGSDLGKAYAWKQLQSRIEYYKHSDSDQKLIDQLRQDPSPSAMSQWRAEQKKQKSKGRDLEL